MDFTDKLTAAAGRLVPEKFLRAAWLRPRYPLVAVEVREDALIAVRLQRRSGAHQLVGYGSRALPEGAFSASLAEPGVGNPDTLAAGFAEVLRLAGADVAGRISVALPDTAARVLLVDLQELPSSHAQADELIRFRIRKSVPFRPEDSRVAWDVLGRSEDGRVEVLVAVAPEAAIAPLEAVLHAMGLRCGLIDLASLGVFNVLRVDGRLNGAAPEDVALVNATSRYFTVMLLRAGRMIFFRARNYHAQGGFRGDESLEAVSRELRSTIGYYDEHLLGEGIRRTYVRAVGVPADGLFALMKEAGCGEILPAEVKVVAPQLRHATPAAAAELLPAIGLALRRQA